jgi:hypothetical protein
MSKMTRDRAYATVKKMKAAYLPEGCDWQIEIEKVIEDVRRDTVELCISIANKHIKDFSAYPEDDYPQIRALESLRYDLVRLNEAK